MLAPLKLLAVLQLLNAESGGEVAGLKLAESGGCG